MRQRNPSPLACSASAVQDSRRASSRSDPKTGDVLAMVGGDHARSINRADAREAAAGVHLQTVRVHGGTGARLLAGVGARTSRCGSNQPQAILNGRPTPENEASTYLTLRPHSPNRNNGGGRQPAATRNGMLRQLSSGLTDMPDVVTGARHLVR